MIRGDDMRGLPVRNPIRHRWFVEAVILIFVAALLSSILSAEHREPVDFDTDQIVINLIVLKALRPELLPRDALYGRNYPRFYIPAYVHLQTLLSSDGDPITGLKRIGIGVGTLFLVSHYTLFRALGTGPLFAGLGALSAMTFRGMLGGEYWGFDGLSVHPRSIVNALTPFLLLAFVRWRAPWHVLGYFLLTGVLVSLHPVSGLHLFLAGAVVHLIIERFRLRAQLEVSGGAACFLLGALPFLVGFLPGRDNITDPALFPILRQIQEYRWPFLFLPPSPSLVRSVAFAMLLPAALFWWLWRGGGLSQDVRRLVLFGTVAFGGGILGTGAIQAWALLTDRPYLTHEQLRMSKLVYPALVLAFPLAYQRIWTRNRVGLRVLVAFLVLLSLVPPQQLIINSAEWRNEAKRILGMQATPPRRVRAERLEPDEARALWEWARRETSADALFFIDSLRFRVAARRSISGAFKDGGIVALAGTRPLYEWYQYMRPVERCRAQAGKECWFALASQSGADFVVVDSQLPLARPRAGFVKVWERGEWSVWKRLDR